jgi:hypothetical protein
MEKWLRHWPRGLVLALLGSTLVVLLLGHYPHRSLAGRKPTLLEEMTGIPPVVIGIRLVLLYVFVFVLASVLARIWNQQWLRKAGPFEVSDEVETLKDEVVRLTERARTAEARLERFTLAIQDSDKTIRTLSQALRKKERKRRGLQRRASSQS